MSPLATYLHLLSKKKLRVDRSHGQPAPHKPVLLLSLLQAFRAGWQQGSFVAITPELVALFKSNWNALVHTKHECKFYLPFFHLQSSGFWQLQPSQQYALLPQSIPQTIPKSIHSLPQLLAFVEGAQLNEELYHLMKEPATNQALELFLLDEYFPHRATQGTTQAATQVATQAITAEQGLLFIAELENKIVREKASDYKQEIELLLQQKDEEEMYIRSSLFKRQVVRVYNNTCCISGMRVDALNNASMIDACHIIPFSLSHDDTIGNGIALCPTLHRAFDRGLVSVDENYRVMVSKAFAESPSRYALRQFQGQQLLVPALAHCQPLSQNFAWHREMVFEQMGEMLF